MKISRSRFTFRRVLAASALAGLVAIVAVREYHERLRVGAIIDRARTAYLDAKGSREVAEGVLKDYTEGTYRRELASAESEIEKAEDQVSTARDSQKWADHIRSKGYLLLIPDDINGRLAVQKASFAVEQAKTKKTVLERYTKAKTIRGLTARVEKARAIEMTEKASYDRSREARIGWFHWVTRVGYSK